MKRLFIILFIFSIVLPTFAEDKDGSIYTINGVQVFVLDSIYKDNIDMFLDEIKEKGINTVFLRAFHNKSDRAHFGITPLCESGVYFRTDSACMVSNLVPKFVKKAHEKDIKVFGWMASRSLSFLKTDENMMMSLSPDNTIIQGYGANIFKQNVRDTIITLFKDLARTGVDGILFQDDFIIKYTEGADKLSAELFEKETGLKVKNDTFFGSTKEYNGKLTFSEFKDEFYIWAEWKNKELVRLFSEIRKAVKEVNPKILLAANIYYETPINEKQGLAWYSQKMSTLDNARVDYFAVMGYAEQIGSEQKLTGHDTAQYIGNITKEAVRQAGGNRDRVIMKLQSKSFVEKDKMIRQLDFNRVCYEVAVNSRENGWDRSKKVSKVIVPVNKSSDILVCPF